MCRISSLYDGDCSIKNVKIVKISYVVVLLKRLQWRWWAFNSFFFPNKASPRSPPLDGDPLYFCSIRFSLRMPSPEFLAVTSSRWLRRPRKGPWSSLFLHFHRLKLVLCKIKIVQGSNCLSELNWIGVAIWRLCQFIRIYDHAVHLGLCFFL